VNTNSGIYPKSVHIKTRIGVQIKPELLFKLNQNRCSNKTRIGVHNAPEYANGTFTWFEYGPEHLQEEIEATCSTGLDGAEKSATATDYYQDKQFYLKITSVEQN